MRESLKAESCCLAKAWFCACAQEKESRRRKRVLLSICKWSFFSRLAICQWYSRVVFSWRTISRHFQQTFEFLKQHAGRNVYKKSSLWYTLITLPALSYFESLSTFFEYYFSPSWRRTWVSPPRAALGAPRRSPWPPSAAGWACCRWSRSARRGPTRTKKIYYCYFLGKRGVNVF